MPPFSPPVLSQQQLNEKAKLQKKKLQNLLPQKNQVFGRNNFKQTPSSSDKQKTKKVKVPRLKAIGPDGQVLDAPQKAALIKVKIPIPSPSDQKALYCPACKKIFDKERGYRQHMNKRHGITLSRGRNKERRFHCSEVGCTRSFYQRSDLRRHQRVHLGVKPFKCSICHKEFTQRGSLYRHATSSHKTANPKDCIIVQTGTTLPIGTKTKTVPRPEALSRNILNTNSNQNDNDVGSQLYELPPRINEQPNGNNDAVMMDLHNRRLPPPLIPVNDDEITPIDTKTNE